VDENTIFPDDENGDVFRRIQASGDFTAHREVDFVVVFPDQTSAERFAAQVRSLCDATAVEETHTALDFPWDVRVTRKMELTHQEVTDFENLLAQIADSFGGHNDGWGCLSNPPDISS
jgi:hypothetical protein